MDVEDLDDGGAPLPWERRRKSPPRRVPHLVLAWSLDEPDRIGEVVPIADRLTLGRGGALDDDPAPRRGLHRMRPGATVAGPPIASARVARCQMIVEPRGDDGVWLKSFGPARMRIGGRQVTEGEASAGDVVEIHNAAVFLVTSRPTELSASGVETEFGYGAPDPFGIVGESETA